MSNFTTQILTLLIFIFALNTSSVAQGLPMAKPESVQMSSVKLNKIDDLVNQAIAEKKMPGAVVLVGRKGKIVFRKAFGKRSIEPKVEDMTVDTIFDLASLTKPIATATSIMILIEQDKIHLDDTLGKFIPEIEDEIAKQVTIKQLLTHTSGYSPAFDLRKKWRGRDGLLEIIKKKKLRNFAGTKFIYSDIGFVLLGEIIQRVEKRLFQSFFELNVRRKLSLPAFSFNFLPLKDESNTRRIIPKMPIASTENIKGQKHYLYPFNLKVVPAKDNILRGTVHDPIAYRMNGIAGNSGLFATADDLARFCQMLLNGGIMDGIRVLLPSSVAIMKYPSVVSENGDARGLGWDINTKFSTNRGELFPLGSFGHTGFTGTGVWIDPLSETFVIFLSNRVHPDGRGNIVDVRAKVSTIVASAVKDITPAQIRDFEEKYNAKIAVGIDKFKKEKTNVYNKAIRNLPLRNYRKPIPNLVPIPNAVSNGIDVLQSENFRRLKDLKVGLVTNHTGRNFAGKSTLDILNEAKNLKLVSLFSPEHGIRGELDQSKINDSIDKKTGLQIYSLYGKSRRPKAEQIENLDALVFDIQDIGTRFYTYISTLRYLLEEAAKSNKKVFVLDRPNPINGEDVAGAIADDDKLSFVATHTLPIRHGMTIGEIALMLNDENKIGADLEIIKMQNWRRSMWFDETSQTWINPSPNMRNLTQSTLYPGIGLLETTNLSVGRGTDTPFELIGSPWINGRILASYLNNKNLKGVRFVPITFTPKSSVFNGEKCNGINIIITNRKTFEPVKTGLLIALALRRLNPKDWNIEQFNRLLANQETFELVKSNAKWGEIENLWKEPLEVFLKRRANYLLY